PLEERQGAGVGRAAARAGRRDLVRPRQRPAHPPRLQAAALARGQGAGRLHVRPAELSQARLADQVVSALHRPATLIVPLAPLLPTLPAIVRLSSSGSSVGSLRKVALKAPSLTGTDAPLLPLGG